MRDLCVRPVGWNSVVLMCTLSLLGLVGSAVVGCSTQTETPPSSQASSDLDAPSGPVTFAFDLDGTIQTVVVDDVAEGTLLETVMRGIDAVELEISGSGTTAFVNKIGDQDTGSSEGWTFKVDGEFASHGIGTTELSPPTTIAWSYGNYSP